MSEQDAAAASYYEDPANREVAGPLPGISPAYERLREGVVARTVTVSDDVMADVDEHGLVLGVETLDGSDWRDALAELARAGRLAVISRRA